MHLHYLKHARLEAGMTLAGLVELSVGRIEHGRPCRPGTARRLAEALGVRIADLLGGTGGHALGARQGSDATDPEWLAATERGAR